MNGISYSLFTTYSQIPEKSLDEVDRSEADQKPDHGPEGQPSVLPVAGISQAISNGDNINKTYGSVATHPVVSTSSAYLDDEEDSLVEEGIRTPTQARRIPIRRRLSMYECSDGGMDLEDEYIGGSARSF